MMSPSLDTTTKENIMENTVHNIQTDTVAVDSVFAWMQRSGPGGASDI